MILKIQHSQFINLFILFALTPFLKLFGFGGNIYLLILIACCHSLIIPQYIFQVTQKLYQYNWSIFASRFVLLLTAYFFIDYEIIFIDDGSIDSSWSVIKNLCLSSKKTILKKIDSRFTINSNVKKYISFINETFK